jgi:hypothetical protein
MTRHCYLFSRNSNKKGFALGLVIFAIAISLSLAVVFLNRSSINLSLTGVHSDSVVADLQMEAAYEEARGLLSQGVSEIRMDGAFQVHPDTPNTDSIQTLADVYGVSLESSLNFLRHAVESQAIDASGDIDESHQFADFDAVFANDWTLFNLQNAVMERRYTFTPRLPVTDLASGNPSILFQYAYTLEVRAYGGTNFSQSASQEKGMITIFLSRAPFSRFALFRSQNANQNGNILVFAGGDTSAQHRDIFSGPVHMNQAPRFHGAPIFADVFTSGAAKSTWAQTNGAGYSGSAVFMDQALGDQPQTDLPTEVSNVIRLAAGDPSPQAAYDTTDVTNNDLVDFLRESAGVTLPGTATSVPAGVYIPVDSQATLNPQGGIYVEGDSQIQLNVVQGETDFAAGRWSGIAAGDKSCKFQKIKIDHLGSASLSREIYVADDPCNSTYIFTSDAAAVPQILPGRINGNLHVNGKIDRLGGESRNRPAIAQDFGFTISASKDVRIINDLQYEDVVYHAVDSSDGSMSASPVATPWASLDGSSQSTDFGVAPKISDDSKTVLGILSTKRNVMLHIDAPANLNLHAAILAGNPEHFNSSTGLGCGANEANKKGCGFGNEGWQTKSGMGSFKFLGSISEYRSQSMGVTSNPPTGYQRRLMYDVRFLQDLTPPAYPLSTSLQAIARIENFRAWRLVQADD